MIDRNRLKVTATEWLSVHRCSSWRWVAVTIALAVGALGGAVTLAVAAEGDSGPAVMPASPGSRPTATSRPRNVVGRVSPMSALDRRVHLLATELNLDSEQQSAVRHLLLKQREDTLKVWSDESVPPAVRIKATQGVSDRTAEQIRALLNDAQREKYIKPHDRIEEQNKAAGELDGWMRGDAPKGAVAPAATGTPHD